ncbi:MAG: alpha-amylase family glycosyl hydrolase [Candidatus Cloacimonas sp.]|jgi:glycosidase|nr:alpha-amylase family glycosyl hydrolase [Candidatus Cloacimonas sp.]
MRSIRFSYSPLTAGKHQVGLAGDFSNWQIVLMEDFGGVYLIAIDLAPGEYRYKFIVDGNWIYDESNPQRSADPYGGFHSLLNVEDEERKLTWDDILDYTRNKTYADSIKLYRSGEEAAELRFSWYIGMAEQINLHLGDEVYTFKRIGQNALYDVYCLFLGWKVGKLEGWKVSQAPLSFPRRRESSPLPILNIIIEIIYQDNRIYLCADGFVADSNTNNSGARNAPLQNPHTPEHPHPHTPILINLSDYPIFSVPAWVGKGIIYQIFPDRFCNGDRSIDPDFSEWYYADCKTPPSQGEILQPEQEYFHLVQDWNDVSGLSQSPYLEEGKSDWWSFYGGDIAGVQSKLDYLCDLGIDIIYFNPLWQAKSNHKYDSADYHSIDPHFGTVEQMTAFVTAAHAKGIKIILDVAFNHTGETFWAFRDTVEKGSDSHYWNWYDWKKWPLPKPLPVDFKPREYYQCWWGIKDMPDLNYDLSRHHPEENAIRNIEAATVNEPLITYLLETIRWWLQDIGIDGFRLDVPDEVPFWFWQLFRQEVKSCKPDAWIVGEIWHDAQGWVNAKYFDSVMNYAYFKNPVIEFFIFKLIQQDEFIQRIETGLALYPFHALQAMMNLLGGHDTLRIFELAKGDIARLKLAVLFKMCFLGAPHIYYGDEIALPGGKDPDNRRPFNWDWESSPVASDLRSFYQELILLRRSNLVFSEGSFAFIPTNNGILSFERRLADKTIHVYINPQPDAIAIAIPAEMHVIFGSASSSLPANSAIILAN